MIALTDVELVAMCHILVLRLFGVCGVGRHRQSRGGGARRGSVSKVGLEPRGRNTQPEREGGALGAVDCRAGIDGGLVLRGLGRDVRTSQVQATKPFFAIAVHKQTALDCPLWGDHGAWSGGSNTVLRESGGGEKRGPGKWATSEHAWKLQLRTADVMRPRRAARGSVTLTDETRG